MPTIAVCEDDAALRQVLVRALRGDHHEVVVAQDGGEAVRLFTERRPDVMVLDIRLPDADGRDVCLALRGHGLTAPVLFLTALDGMHDKLAGFRSGGDDYLTKPFEVPELLARVDALARRGAPPSRAEGLRLDPARHALLADGAEVALTPTEYRLLARLLARPGDAVRRQALIAAAWPDGAIVHDNTLDSYIRRIRRKLESVDDAGARLHTVRGVGYSWRE